MIFWKDLVASKPHLFNFMPVYSSIRANIEGGECIISSEQKIIIIKKTKMSTEQGFDRLSQ